MVALSRPHHYAVFALFLGLLFIGTFKATQAMARPDPETLEVETLPLLVEVAAEPIPAAQPAPLGDLVVGAMSARECVSTAPDREAAASKATRVIRWISSTV